MDKSRSRSAAHKLIIDKPELQTSRQRVLFGAATVAAWVMWIYMWLPLITLVGWYFGASRFHEVMIVKSGASHFSQVIGWYALIILGICTTLICWALYNWARFHDAGRRVVDPANVSGDEMAVHTRVSNEVLERARARRNVTVRHDAHGVIVAVRTTKKLRGPEMPPAPTEKAPEVQEVAGAT